MSMIQFIAVILLSIYNYHTGGIAGVFKGFAVMALCALGVIALKIAFAVAVATSR
jgi:hypothetical protein